MALQVLAFNGMVSSDNGATLFSLFYQIDRSLLRGKKKAAVVLIRANAQHRIVTNLLLHKDSYKLGAILKPLLI